MEEKKIKLHRHDLLKLKQEKSLKAQDPIKEMFKGKDLKMKKTVEQSEFDKAYNGKPSYLDGVDFDAEYCGFFKSKKGNRKYDNKKHSDYNWGSSTISEPLAMPSELHDTDSLLVQSVKEKESHRINDALTNIEEKEFDVIDWKQGDSLISQAELIQKNTQGDDKSDFALTIAEDFVKREKFAVVGGAIYHYNGKFYSLISEDALNRLIFNTYRKEIGRASPLSIIRNVTVLLRYCISTEFEEFPTNSNIIVFENGTLELDTGRFRKNSPKDLSSSALGINYCSDCKKMPHTQYFLNTIANGDDDLYELMLQVIGYILSNDTRAKSFFYLEGVGNAGKSKFCDLVASFFPISGANKVARIALQDLGGRFALGNLVNTKLNISEDLPDSPLSPTTVSKIKMISDSNRLEAEAKYVQAFSFRPICKLLFASNHPLRIKEYDAAFINRVVYIPFMRSIPKHKQDRDILMKMQGELSALFNHALSAYRRLVASGYVWSGTDKFKPEICVINSGISIDKELILRHFVDSCCCFEEDCIVSTSELQEAYQSFCQKNRYEPIAGDRFSRELFAFLPSTVARIKIGNQRRGLKGVKLK